jgi:hypothetical protein
MRVPSEYLAELNRNDDGIERILRATPAPLTAGMCRLFSLADSEGCTGLVWRAFVAMPLQQQRLAILRRPSDEA